ncbi:MAG: hypothetical protein M1831_001918 [Alyxoria varia]|nr:MAG: hypothetical protein M1831_001918 [Alyxoria varia]
MSAQTPPPKSHLQKSRSARRHAHSSSGAPSGSHESPNGLKASVPTVSEHVISSEYTQQQSRGSKKGVQPRKKGVTHAIAHGEQHDTAHQQHEQDHLKDYTRTSDISHRSASGAVSDSATLDGTVQARRGNICPQDGLDYGSHNKMAATPSKQVYAGPLFHASPAASSLPLPKLFSRTPAMSSESTVSVNDSSTSPSHSPHSMRNQIQKADHQQGREASPLDILFNAQRAERERARASMGTAAGDSAMTGTVQYSSPQNVSPYHKSSKSIGSAGDAFVEEMDGITDTSDSEEQTTTLPFRERLHAVRSTGHADKDPDEEQRQEKTRALKQLLMTPSGGNSNRRGVEASTVMTCGPQVDNAPAKEACQNGLAGTQRSELQISAINSTEQKPLQQPSLPQIQAQSPPPAQASHCDQRKSEIKSMEENLRKILKLENT